jgi:glycosyltransferase involved in cell wall biosynthesis
MGLSRVARCSWPKVVRILQCIDTLQPGGAERQLCYLTEGLVRRGHEVGVAYVGGGPYEHRLRAAGAELHPIATRLAPLQWVRLRRAIADRRAELVQTWLGRMNVVGGAASRSLGRPWIYCERSVRLHDRGLPGLVRGWLGARASLLVANSYAGAELWRSIRARRANAVVANGVPLDELDAVEPAERAQLGVPADAEWIVWAGRFVPAKNLDVLADLLARVLTARPRAIAWCCGEGVERDRFEAILRDRGIAARCHLPGHRHDLWRILKSADLFVSPSVSEGRPNVVLEAMALGCPLVLSDIAPHREVAPGDAALFFATRSACDAAEAIGRALDDRDATRARVERARAAVRNQSTEAMVDAYLHLYRLLVRP